MRIKQKLNTLEFQKIQQLMNSFKKLCFNKDYVQQYFRPIYR